MVATKKTRKTTKKTTKPKAKPKANAPKAKAPKAKAKDKSHTLKRVSHDEEGKIELSPLRKAPAVAQQENVVCIVKVRKPRYVPDGFSVRTWIDDTLYTADCTGIDLQNASKDPNVESISPAERVRQIG